MALFEFQIREDHKKHKNLILDFVSLALLKQVNIWIILWKTILRKSQCWNAAMWCHHAPSLWYPMKEYHILALKGVVFFLFFHTLSYLVIAVTTSTLQHILISCVAFCLDKYCSSTVFFPPNFHLSARCAGLKVGLTYLKIVRAVSNSVL